jgi:UDP-glucose 4-epimerase
MDKYKIGIVGGAGFIGSSLARHMNQSFQVKILDVKEPTEDLGNVEFRQCDIRIYEEVKKCTQDLDLIIHTAIVQIPLINQNRRLGYEVNVVGTQNLCKAVYENLYIKGMILSGSWHTIGEKQLKGVIDEEFGFRPDKVEDRARSYALSKIAQECIVRLYDEMSEKVFAIIRMGTVLGEGMPETTAANIFITRGLEGKSITPYKHSMHRPMLYVDICDVCKAFERFALKILSGGIKNESNSLAHIVNVYYPNPMTIQELAENVQKAIIKHTQNTVTPAIETVDKGLGSLFSEYDKKRIKVDVSKAINFLGLNALKSPEETINRIVKKRIEQA